MDGLMSIESRTKRRHPVPLSSPMARQRQRESPSIERVTLDFWTFNRTAEAFFKQQGFTGFNERLWQIV